MGHPFIRTIVFWGLYWVLLFYGTYHVSFGQVTWVKGPGTKRKLDGIGAAKGIGPI